ncbi:MAG: FtsX-like permease family protein, partial [Betaproteobacteria bacterium]
LRVLGVTRAGALRILVVESIAIGVAGAGIGVALGYTLAWLAVGRFGGDLGAGYFNGVTVQLRNDPLALVAYFALGVGAALAGSAVPAWRAANSAPAPALKSAAAMETSAGERPWWPGVALLAATPPLALLPPAAGLPLGGYAAVAVLLAGALWLAPAVAGLVLRPLPSPRNAVALIAFGQLRGVTSQFHTSVAAIVVSFSLMAAMLIMIGSFRGSLEQWLRTILPADVYARAGGGQTGYLDPETVRRIAALPGVARSASVRWREVALQPERVPVTVLARDLDAAQIAALPLLGQPRARNASGLPPVWVSEAAVDLYGWTGDSTIDLVLDGRRGRFAVAGVWRDYARQNGALLIARSDYIALTGDERTNDLWLWLAPGASAAALAVAIDADAGGAGLIDVRNAAAIRKVSLALFDRTFAVTYLLEAVAVLIGLFGISVGFSSQALARRAEFGMLRHIGVTRRQVGAMLGIEGLAAGLIGVLYGLATGGVISLILIHVINRQSFHWSMDLHVPVLPLLVVSVVLILAATGTAVASGRRAMGGQPIAAVKEDW